MSVDRQRPAQTADEQPLGSRLNSLFATPTVRSDAAVQRWQPAAGHAAAAKADVMNQHAPAETTDQPTTPASPTTALHQATAAELLARCQFHQATGTCPGPGRCVMFTGALRQAPFDGLRRIMEER